MNHTSHGPGHEKTDFTFQNVIWMIPASMVILVTFVVTVWFAATSALSHEMARKEKQGAAFGKEMLMELRAQEDSLLGSYQWQNKEKTVARIPIQRAMELIAAEAITPVSEKTGK